MINTLYGLPDSVIFCSRCVISNQRPNSVVEFKAQPKDSKKTIHLEDGICDACLVHEDKLINTDWAAREKELILLKESALKVNGYDCIVPGSGGKDSAFTAHVLKYRYGFSPLTVTWAPHLYTDIGWQNFQNWMHVGGLDNILFTPNGRLHRELTRQAFINLLHPFQPFIIGQKLIGPYFAKKLGIPLVFYGENQAEYGNPRAENSSRQMDNEFFSAQNPDSVYLGGKSIRELLKETSFKIEDFSPYMPMPPHESNIQVHYLGYYLKWDPQECFYYAEEHTGFEPNPERTEGSFSRYSSIDDKIDPFHYFTTLIKFGLGRASYDAAQEIRNGKISREEGVSLVKKYDSEFPEKYFETFLDYIGLDQKEFWQRIDQGRPDHLWKKTEKGDFELRHPIWGN